MKFNKLQLSRVLRDVDKASSQWYCMRKPNLTKAVNWSMDNDSVNPLAKLHIALIDAQNSCETLYDNSKDGWRWSRMSYNWLTIYGIIIWLRDIVGRYIIYKYKL